MPQSALFPNNKPPLLFLLCSLLLGLNSLSYGETWTLKNSGVTDLLHDITFTDPNNGWAVGRSGVIIHTTDGGESWTPQMSNVTVPLHSVDFVDSLNGWAVGLVVNNEGTILHTTDGGVNWVWQGNGQRTAMYDIEFLDHQNGIAVGGQALIMRTTDEGETWTTLNEEPNILFWDIEIIDESTWYIAGQHNINPWRPPVMYHTTDAGQTWSVLAEDGDWGLQSVSFIDALNGWASGWFGEVLHTTDGGQTWTPQESGRTDEILFEVVFRDQNIGWTVGGERGCQLWNCDSLQGAPNVVLLTTDGGETWDLRPPLTDQLYVKIYFYSPDTAWIVGDGGTILKTTDATSVIPDPPNQTILLEPVDSAIVAQDSVTFLWQSGSGVDTYWLEYDTSSAFLSPVVDSTLTDTSHTVAGLQDNTEYWWRARGRNAFGWGSFSEMRQFIVSIPTATPDSVILLQPSNGANDIPTSVDFLWMQIEADSSDSLTYHLQLTTDTLFASLVFEDSSLVDTTVHKDSLSEESSYFWRVRAANISGTGPWSNTWSFTTVSTQPAAPDSVILLQPSNGASDIPTAVDFLWMQVEADSSDSLTYHLQLTTDTLFASLVFEDSSLVDTTVQRDSLSEESAYFWRVRAANISGTGPWSNTWSFSTAPAPPATPDSVVLLQPADGASDIPTAVDFLWMQVEADSSDSLTYHLQLTTDTLFASLVFEDSSLVDTTVHKDSLSEESSYFWRVRAANVSGTGPWSNTWSFTTVSTQPPAPDSVILLEPADGASDIPTAVDFLWMQVEADSSDSLTYHLQLATDTLFASLVFQDSSLVDTTVQRDSLSEESAYFWRVRAANVSGTGPWSNTWSFTTVSTQPAAPDSVILLEPADGASDIPTAVDFLWMQVEADSSDSLTYHLQLATDTLFASLVFEDSSLVDTTVHKDSLSEESSYFWRVRAANISGTGPWSNTWSFTTVSTQPAAPDSVILLQPSNGASDIPTAVDFLWMQVEADSSDSLTYHLQLATDSLFASLVFEDSSLVDTTVHKDSLSEESSYFWRVRAVNVSGTGPWSNTWSFTTVSTQPAAPDSVILLQPSNGASDIPTAVDFLWMQVEADSSDSLTYHLQLATDTLFASLVFEDSSLVDTTVQRDSLSEESSYFWRVRAANISGTGPWSNTWSFSTAPAPPATPDSVVLLQPADGVINQLTPLTLVWESVGESQALRVQREVPQVRETARPRTAKRMVVDGPERPEPKETPLELFGLDSICYHLQLSTDFAFSTVLMEDSTLIDTTYQLDSLAFGGTYHWRVRAIDAGIPGPWSGGRIFMTPDISSIPCLAVRRLQGRCRTNGAIVVAVALANFNYTGNNVVIAIDGVQYMAQVGSNRRAQISVPGFAPGTHTLELVNPGGCVSPVNVSCGALANQVDGNDEGESLEWGDDEGELLESDLPATTELLGSYPNPFNSVATIAFQLAEQTRVDLRIYDILGREIEIIVNEELPAGRYAKTWTATAHASGLYFYRFTVGNSVLTGKLLQVK